MTNDREPTGGLPTIHTGRPYEIQTQEYFPLEHFEEEEGLDPGRLIEVLWRRKWWILACTLLGLAVGVINARFVKPLDTDTILRFRDRAAAAGITIPIVPGIMPVVNFASIVTFSARCGAGIPDWLASQFEGLEDDPETAAMVAASVASEQCRTLIDEGFDGFHFYTLNKAPLSYAVCRYLGINPSVAKAA